MHPFDRVAAWVGIHRVGRTITALLGILLLTGVGLAVLLADAPASSWSAGVDNTSTAHRALDGDGDGLADAIENRIGSNAASASTLGANVSDGWLHHWYGTSIDWSAQAILDAPALAPPLDALPGPLREPGALDPPTVAGLYAMESSWRDPQGKGGAWWIAGSLDPRQWDNRGDGVADAWLASHGIDPLHVDVERRAPGDATMTLARKYDLGLDPHAEDTDGDGLTDTAEVTGSTIIAGKHHTFAPTDAGRASSRGDGIADGYLVRFGLDPHEQGIAGRALVPGGATVAEGFQTTRDHCMASSPGNSCDWRQHLETGPLVDPTAWDSLGDGVPDVWSMRDAHGLSHPLRDARTVLLNSTKEWDASAWSGGPAKAGVVVDDTNPLPDQLYQTTAADHYAFMRPSWWDEARDGPWWGGLPTLLEPQDGALPPAVALRGWNLTVDAGLGRNASELPSGEDLMVVAAGADPRSRDTDGDGLTDRNEYYGTSTGGRRTSPNDADTDGDGLTDQQEADDGLGTNPLRRDSSGSFLTDGQEHTYWSGEASNASAALASGSTVGPNGRDYGWLFMAGHAPADLAPLGSLQSSGVSNILSDDVDGDGLKDGEELFPNRFLRTASKGNPRPPTDPARVDTDGDGLPDWWEVAWSQDIYWRCAAPCWASGHVAGWPLDPSRLKSVDVDGVQSDRGISLSREDEVQTASGARAFTNGLAYAYDLNPYRNDTDGDGIKDMFAIHWGVEAVPDLPGIAAAGWPAQQAAEVAGVLRERGYSPTPDVVVIHPNAKGAQQVDLDSNLLGMFTDRGKGTWITTIDPSCDGEDRTPGLLPAEGAQREIRYPDGTGAGKIPARAPAAAHLEAPCWRWVEHPLSSDVQGKTSPWRHDSDDDGLPDAWERLYGEDLAAELDTPGSTRGGCHNETLRTGLPPANSYCLSYMQSYGHGLDPSKTDTDGGGLADWIEVALALNPRNPADDHGEEDWDGDGLPNRVEDKSGTNRLSPDTDGDGLLDSDPLGQELLEFHQQGHGAGDLCIRAGNDLVQADAEGRNGMEHRPGGALTHIQRMASLVAAGIIMETDPAMVDDQCGDMAPEGVAYTLLLREGTGVDEDWGLPISSVYIGAGAGLSEATDPTAWDTSGDGLPDGWIVHWRNQARGDSKVQSRLDPVSASGQDDPDEDLLTTLDEYLYGRPSDWREGRDGVWWGGLDPTRIDTDGDGPDDAGPGWFSDSFDALDDLDPDQDNDGLWDDNDPHPGIDPANAGITSWDGQRHITDFPALWAALRDRSGGAMPDEDGDTVPDFLDRARVRVEDVDVDAMQLRKGGEAFVVTGRVVLDEAPAQGLESGDYHDVTGGAAAEASGAGVGGATVRVVLWDGVRESTVGFGFTASDGFFSVNSRVADATPQTLVRPVGASVAGTKQEPGVVASLPTKASALNPGDVQLSVLVEANDPALQPLALEGSGEVRAYKETSGSHPFHIPTNRRESPLNGGLRAFVMDDVGRPDNSPSQVLHATSAVFPARAMFPDGLVLTADAALKVSLPGHRLLVDAGTLNVTGSLVDDDEVGIGGERIFVVLRPHGDSNPVIQANATTGAEGLFHVSLPTTGLVPGSYEVHVGAVLSEEASRFLNAPSDFAGSIVLAQDTHWVLPARVGDVPVTADSVLVDVKAGQPIVVQARLIDHLGRNVTAGSVTLTLSTLDGAFATVLGVMQDGGLVHGPLGPIDPALVGLEDVTLTLAAERVTPQDVPASLKVLLRPRFATAVSLENATSSVGDEAVLEGVLYRVAPSGLLPVAGLDQENAILVSPDHGLPQWIGQTDEEGRFRLAVQSGTPAERTWTARFIAPDPARCGAPTPSGCYLATSAPATARSIHASDTRIAVEETVGVRGQVVVLPGRLSLPTGAGVAGLQVTGHWSDLQSGKVNTTTDAHGGFVLELPARAEAGTHQARVSFAGNTTLHPTDLETPLPVQVPMQIVADLKPLLAGAPDPHPYLFAHLTDDGGRTFEGRTLHLELLDPAGNTRMQTTRTTNTTGSISMGPGDFMPPTPGAWGVTLRYDGSDLESNATVEEFLAVRHMVQISVGHAPLNVVPGQVVEVRGRFQSVSDALAPIDLSARLGGRLVGSTEADVAGGWTIRFIAPHLTSGNHALTLAGEGGEGVDVEPISLNVTVEGAVTVTLRETLKPNQHRDVHLSAEHGSTPVAGLEIILVRRDSAGNTLGIHPVTTGSDGTRMLRLTADQAGELAVVSLSDPSIRLASVSHETLTTIPETPEGMAWGPWLAAALAVTAALVWMAFMAWRSRHQRAILDAMDAARHRLLDPSNSPGMVIREVYEQLLRVLAQAGYTPGDQETVRDISAHATRAFRLHAHAMATLSRLFELAAYSEEPLGATHRQRALSALQQVTAGLGDEDDRRRPFRLPPKTNTRSAEVVETE